MVADLLIHPISVPFPFLFHALIHGIDKISANTKIGTSFNSEMCFGSKSITYIQRQCKICIETGEQYKQGADKVINCCCSYRRCKICTQNGYDRCKCATNI